MVTVLDVFIARVNMELVKYDKITTIFCFFGFFLFPMETFVSINTRDYFFSYFSIHAVNLIYFYAHFFLTKAKVCGDFLFGITPQIGYILSQRHRLCNFENVIKIEQQDRTRFHFTCGMKISFSSFNSLSPQP